MQSNMITLARSKQPTLPEKLDTDPWLLNVINGTVNLRTGKLHESRREDMITMQANVMYDPDATCPRWLKFIDEIMASDIDLVRYLQQIVGICLTGDITEQILPIFYGQGRNGKSTFLDTVTGLMGDYAGKAAPGLLTVKKQQEHSTEIADLAGRRLVVASETEEGKRLRVQLVKELTGDATLKARKMRCDYSEFQRTHKTILVTNNKPVIREPKEAIWRRIQLVPFTVQFAGEQEDTGLLVKLRAERPGILLWAIEGCLAWQQDGLLLAGEVKVATAAYKDEQNFLEEFFADRCIRGVAYTCSRKDMWQAYQEWAKAVGERYPLGRNAFYERIGSLDGVEATQFGGYGKACRGWRGIDVVAAGSTYDVDA